MFTGIVEARGTVVAFDGDRLQVDAGFVASDASVDDSIAINGVCLTVVERDGDVLGFDVSPETRDRTSLDRLDEGSRVNLERPLTLLSRIGGHLVQGHVDGVGTVLSVDPDAVGATVTVEVPAEMLAFMVEKGSITVDGVSLTIATMLDQAISIAVIPHTMAVTTFGELHPGQPVNIEVDIIAKYVAASKGANR